MGEWRDKEPKRWLSVHKVLYQPFYTVANYSLLYIQIAEKWYPILPSGNIRNQSLGNTSEYTFLVSFDSECMCNFNSKECVSILPGQPKVLNISQRQSFQPHLFLKLRNQ